MPLATEAEVEKFSNNNGKRTFEWHSLPIADAFKEKGQIFRCKECHARVKPHRNSPFGGAYFEHLRGFKGCSLSRDFDGTVRPSPDAID